MSLLRYIAPLRAYRDLRMFLGQRRPHEVVFLTLSIAVTWLIIFYMIHDSKIVRQYHPNLVYVKQWPLSRTRAEIVAQQKIDAPEQTKREEADKKQQVETQAEFKRLDDRLKKWGI